MKKADEILNKIYKETIKKNGTESIQTKNFPSAWSQIAIDAINEARKEAIEECAERATTIMGSDINSNGEAYDLIEVDKQSILSLIKELK